MALANVPPKLDVVAGVAAIEEDIPRVLSLIGASSLEELGWSRPNPLSLLIPLLGIHEGKKDDYLLRLGFQAYRQWPPSAQFVNPETLAYRYPDDQQHVPKLTSPECTTHVAYRRNQGGLPIQLVCCSATLEFYDVLHNVDSQLVWRGEETFYTTIQAIQKAFGSAYKGRFEANGN